MAENNKQELPVLEQTDKNDKESLVLDQTMAYLRECHGHFMTLTGRVLALNIVVLAVYGVILNAPEITNFEGLQNLFVCAFGLLVALFGYVFNLGAWAAHKQILRTANRLKLFINKHVGRTIASDDDYKAIMENFGPGKVSKLTKIFFVICICIWLLLGGTIFYLALCNMQAPTKRSPEVAVGSEIRNSESLAVTRLAPPLD